MKKVGRQKTRDGVRKPGDPSSGVRPLVLPGVLILVSAAVLTVIQAPIDLAFLAWVAYVPFIIACCRPAKPRRIYLLTYVVACLYWAGNLYWIFPVTIAGGVTICLYTGLLWPVLAVCLRFCREKRIPLFFAAGVLIVGIERMQGLFLGGFFWRFLAHSQYENTTIIQIADIFGAGGVSFLIAMVNGLIAELIFEARSFKSGMGKRVAHPKTAVLRLLLAVVLVVAAVIATIAYGRWRIGQEEHCIEPGPMAASLQSNVPQSVKRTFESGDKLFNDLMERSRAASQAGAELIVWPETMVQAMLDTDIWPYLTSPEESIEFDRRLREHAENSVYLLVGAYGAEIRERDSERYLARFNSAFFYTPGGQKSDKRYDKIHLVPFGEVLPLRRTLSRFYELLMKIKFIPYNFDYSLDYGTNYTVFQMAGDDGGEQVQDYRFGVIICYEGTVPEIARKFALNEKGEKNLDWLVNISNDGWFVRFTDDKVRPSTELAQHAAVSAFRAVENRLAVLRSVNTGISCLIDSSGRIRDGYLQGTLPTEAMSRTGMDGWFTDRMPIDTRTSFFSRYGEWLDFCCELCVVLLIMGLLLVKFFGAERWKKRSSKRSNDKSAGQS